jgi:hypothetical protein
MLDRKNGFRTLTIHAAERLVAVRAEPRVVATAAGFDAEPNATEPS